MGSNLGKMGVYLGEMGSILWKMGLNLVRFKLFFFLLESGRVNEVGSG